MTKNIVLENDLLPQPKLAEQLEQHHIIPVSLGGLDIKSNLREILTSPHTLIHQTLKVSEGSMRTLKKALALAIANNDIIGCLKAYQHTQSFYFQNIYSLPDELIVLHYESFLEQIKQLEDMVKDLENFLLKKGLELDDIKIEDRPIFSQQNFAQIHSFMGELRIIRQVLLEEKNQILRYRVKSHNIGLFR